MKKSEKFKLKTLNVLYWTLMILPFLIGCIFSIINDICIYALKYLTECINFLQLHLYTEDWEFNDDIKENEKAI